MENQREVWDVLAEGWYHFRQRPFPPTVINLSSEWEKGKILDVGCGNCRNLVPFAQQGFDCYGIDFSKEMLKSAQRLLDKNKVKAKLKLGRAEKLPFSSESFDYCLSIAVLHHLKEKEREAALKEIKRVLKKNGKALITVWNKLQWRFVLGKKEQYIPWRKKEKTYWRYYYFFTYWELKKLLEKSGFKIVYSSGIFGKNLEFIVKKV